MAFDAVDADGNQELDKNELLDIMREVADEMHVTAPGELDIKCVLKELEPDY
tara:strand:+ start:328 stop:483 length:156 start_codon:yes stop_codon:yes gene_type:complete